MTYGFMGKIARINLTDETVIVEKPDSSFYMQLIGGRNIASYIMLKEIPSNADALGPDNKLIAATSVLTGTSIAGSARHTLAAKSPLTNGYGDSEAGGYWGPELKFAGYDALIIEGIASKPVYVLINDDEITIKDASKLWGQDTGAVQSMIREENNDDKIRVLQTGIAGENLVRYAAVTNDLKHWNGRCGLGAVMGSKKLRAIAVRGSKKVKVKNEEKIVNYNKWFSSSMKNHGSMGYVAEYGTAAAVAPLNSMGLLPSYNFNEGEFKHAKDITGEKLHDELLVRRESCYACPISCKRVVSYSSEKINIDEQYGGPEYETIGMFGPNCGIKNLEVICKANELCARFGLDTISTGGTISFAMECYENNLITLDDTDGLNLEFGNDDALLKMIEKIAQREGIGDLLAEGSARAAKKIGGAAEKFAMHSKGQEIPAHEPRGKWNIALGYAVSPTGADHLVVAHDPSFEKEPNKEDLLAEMDLYPLYTFGLRKPVHSKSLGSEKVRLFVHLQYLWSLYNVLDLCIFIGVPERRLTSLNQLLELVNDVCGWDLSFWEFVKTGEKGIQMARLFNIKNGLGSAYDSIPDRFFEPLKNGAHHNSSINREEFDQAIKTYYEMMGWDNDGIPTYGKFAELGLEDVY